MGTRRMTAQDQLARILHIIPRAASGEGASYDALAEELGVDRETVIDDLISVQSREYYHPTTTGAELQVAMEGDRVSVYSTGALRRPVRLDLREAAALHLGLRLLAAERDDPSLLDRVAALGRQVAWSVPDELDDVVAGAPGACDSLRAALVDCARTRRACAIRYLKRGAREPDRREVDPYLVAYARGKWYAVAWDHGRDEPRVFRVDRVLDVTPGEAFEPRDGFDPDGYLDRELGIVYRADDELEVTVRYSPRVARWLTERGEGEVQDDGSVLVTHTVADPDWIVRHVLQYGPDAEVVAPEEVRGWVREAVG